MAVVTVPLGCLKRGAVRFKPALPRAKQDAIRRLGFGVLNKVCSEARRNTPATPPRTTGPRASSHAALCLPPLLVCFRALTLHLTCAMNLAEQGRGSCRPAAARAIAQQDDCCRCCRAPRRAQLVLLFPHAFWGRDLDLLAHVSEDKTDSGLFFLFYAFHEQLAGGGAVLGALVSGARPRARSVRAQDARRTRWCAGMLGKARGE